MVSIDFCPFERCTRKGNGRNSICSNVSKKHQWKWYCTMCEFVSFLVLWPRRHFWVKLLTFYMSSWTCLSIVYVTDSLDYCGRGLLARLWIRSYYLAYFPCLPWLFAIAEYAELLCRERSCILRWNVVVLCRSETLHRSMRRRMMDAFVCVLELCVTLYIWMKIVVSFNKGDGCGGLVNLILNLICCAISIIIIRPLTTSARKAYGV